jgi:fimbrial isopeptide formation D2 family protein
MLQVTSSETINVKNTLTPTLTKTDTKDIDGETLKNEAKGVSGQVGDTVYFKLHATLPASIQDYKTYRLVFEDTLPKGLTYAPDTFLKVIIENSGKASDRIVLTKDTDYKVVATPNATDGTTNIKIYIKDLLKDIDVSELQSLQNDKITGSYVIDVKYAATIDSDVVLGENQNKAVLHFNNNPYYEGNGYPGYPDPDDKTDNPEPGPGGDTPEDEASVYTFELDLKKTDSSNKVLPGAKFIIRDANNNYAKTVSEGKVTEWTSTKSDANTFTSDAEGKIVISGLGAGTYYLTETEAPSGYNKLTADKTVTITAGTYTKTTGTDGTVTIAPETLTISVDGGNAADGASNKVAMTVINTTAKELPTTGGMGRTLIYTLGALLAIGAAVQLVVRKRMRVEK